MKVLIVSDTHRAHISFAEALEREKPIDMLIHLGDVEGGEYYIATLADCPVHIIAGNNDFFTDLPREEEFFVGKYKVFATHGHRYMVSLGEDRLKEEARRRGVDVVMYGHTHMPALTIEPGLVTLNPGSISYPRQMGRVPSYIVMDITPNGRADYSIRYLE